ncbi:MAG: peptidoglycan-binding protein, partial [Candidatus Methanoperedens sp.]|nr:peptidoglycan-binding protein [Candidatus Methanoperedens sp.]
MNPKKRNLSIRMKGEDVKLLQRDLNKLVFPLKEDGYFGKETKRAVLEFQEKHELKLTGVVDERTARMITKEIKSILSEIVEPVAEGQSDCEASEEARKLNSLQEILKKRLPGKTLRHDAARIWFEARGDPARFLDRIKGSKLESQKDAVLFTLEVADRIGDKRDLIRALELRSDKGEFRDAGKIEAGKIAEWEEKEWVDLISREKIEVPEIFKKEDSSASTHAFAKELRTTFERAYPKQAIRSHFEKHAESYAWGKSVHNILRKETSLDPSVPVVSIEREHPELFKDEEGREARRGLATFQRLHRLTKSLTPIHTLVGAGLNSARAIAQTDPADFAQRFAPAFDKSIDEAATVHARAVHASAMAKLMFSTLSDQFNRKSLAVLGSPEPTDEQGQALSTWRDLFGSEDLGFCECAHCKSIFGPAAYLFDMLLFLDRFAAPHQLGQGRTLLDNFRIRRPDVPGLQLSCKNTNVEVPHIDLV